MIECGVLNLTLILLIYIIQGEFILSREPVMIRRFRVDTSITLDNVLTQLFFFFLKIIFYKFRSPKNLITECQMYK